MTIPLGLKAGTDPIQLHDRLQHNPDIFEFYLNEFDVSGDGLKRLSDEIDEVKATTKKIVMHHPMKIGEQSVELAVSETADPRLYRFVRESTETLIQLAKDKSIQTLIHGSYNRQTPTIIAEYPNFEVAESALFNRMDYYQKYGQNNVMFENSISDLFYYGSEEMDEFILQKGYRLAFDTSHAFIKQAGSNADLQASLKRLMPNIVHYHLVDSMGEFHDSLPLGKGKIDWKLSYPLLNPNATAIYEIDLENQNDCREMLESHEYLQNLIEK
ncbi:sugar phosphate isomerase/epimerase family protein [Dellaglioa sp. P0083]|uniref:sugar phosphate isomerase/epimerase family protein n=1 Tax=Dellaglioa kimchii TaxID=3344667 RepID=UPI0038D454BB